MALAPGVVARVILSSVGEVSSLSKPPLSFPDTPLQLTCPGPADVLETICGELAAEDGAGGLF